MNKANLQVITGNVDWTRDFLSDRAHEFVQHELLLSGPEPTARQRQLMATRCTAHLMAVANCSRTTASTAAIQAVSEVVSRKCPMRIDTNRSTSFALFLTGPSGETFALSTADLLDLFKSFGARQQDAY